MKKIVLSLFAIIFYAATFGVTTTIVSSGYTFSPSSVTINSGDSVLFQLASIHDVQEVSQSTWNANGSTALPGGFSLPFGGGLLRPAELPVGVHYFVCQPHASLGMKGIITVNPATPATVTFQTLYGVADSTSDSWAANILQTADGGYIAAGYISNFGAGGDDISLLKLTANGDTSWVRTYGAGSDDDAKQIMKTNDGGYVIAGVTSSYNGRNAFLLKTDGGGNTEWSQVYGSGTLSSHASVSSVAQTHDSGFVIAGYISNYGAGGDDFYLLKTDAFGNIIWTKTYGGANADDAYSVIAANDGGYVIAGATSSFGDTLGDVYLIKLNATGDTLWTWTYGSNLTDALDQANSVLQTSDHGYIIAGVTQSNSQGEYALLIKTDSTGVMQWSKLYGAGTSSSDALATAVVQTSDGGFAFTGYISNFGAGNDDYYLVKTNANGDTMFTRTFGGSGADDASGIAQTADGGYILSGWTGGFLPNGGGFAYYVKTDADGHTSSCSEFNTGTSVNTSITFYAHRTATQISSGGTAAIVSFSTDDGGTMRNPCGFPLGIIETKAPDVKVSVYPVPFSSEATVKINSSQDLHDGMFITFDAMGRQLSRIETGSSSEFNIQGGNLASGIYFYQFLSSGQVLSNGILTIEH